MNPPDFTTLGAAVANSWGELGSSPEPDQGAVVLSWPSVPVELIRASGLRPVFACGSPAPTPAADAVLEPGVFPGRIRQLFEAALNGQLANVAAIILPRTSDPDYKAFLYLKELRRLGLAQTLPPVLLFDLLQSQGPDVAAYNQARSGELLAMLAAIAGKHVGADALTAQITHANAARAAARRLSALRRNRPRVRGAEAQPLLAARWHLPPERYLPLADRAVEVLATRAPLTGPRLLLTGAPVDSPALHAAIEALHAIVVDELSPFGNCPVAEDVDATIDPLAALAQQYGRHAITARASSAAQLRRFEDSLDGIDAVVMLLPPDDARFGWDYPRLRATLDERGIAHAVLAVDPEAPLAAADIGRLQTLLAQAAQLQAACHG